MIVGHNHYDHNLDLAYITPHLHSNAIILGSKTLKHTFAPLRLERPIVDVNANVAKHKEMGKWWYHPNQRVRILPILSEHPNQYLFFHLFTRSLQQDRMEKPQKVFHYQEGLTFAFLIDFIRSNRIQRRVYIQTTSTGFPMGSFPKKILELAQETGFILLGWEELTAVDYENHYLYSLYQFYHLQFLIN